MNYIDIAVLALLALGLLFGLAGKAPKKIFKLIESVAAVVVAAMFTDKALETLSSTDVSTIPVLGSMATPGQTFTDFINATLASSLGGAGIPTDALSGMISGFVKFFVFWFLAIGCFIAFGIVGGIISAILFGHAKKGTAVKTFGIFGLLKSAVVWTVLLAPVLVLAPVASNLSSLPIDLGENAATLQTVQDQVNGSFVIQTSDKILSDSKLAPMFGPLNYTIKDSEGKETQCYLYNDIKTVPGMLELAGKLSEGDPMTAITTMEDEDIIDLFNNIENSPALKEVVVEVFESIIPEEAGIDLSDVDLSKEGGTFVAVKNLMGVMEDETAAQEYLSDPENITDLVDNIAESQIVAALAEANPGMLADIPESTKTDIENQLAAKVGTGEGEISQEQYDSLMKLFASGSGN